jgi:Flp pilus assembly protein TadB
VMSVIRPTYAQELYQRPALMIYCLVSVLLGWMWMRRILNFSF